MNEIKKIFVLNLERRKDKLNFMKYKLNDIGIKNYEVIYGIDGEIDLECEVLYENYLKTMKDDDYIPNTKIPFIHKKTVFAIIKSFKIIYEKVLDYDYDENSRILIFEDDVIFSKKFNSWSKLDYENDVIYLGANQNSFKKEWKGNYSLENDFKYITNGMYSIIYKVSFIKKFYNKYLTDISNIRKPIDYLLWRFITENKISNIVVFPNLTIPNLLNSDNMEPRDLIKYSKLKKWNLNNYKFINLEMKYNDLVNNCKRIKKGKIDNIYYSTIYKIIDGNF